MMMWRQYTYKNGELAYAPAFRTPDAMIEVFAQICLLRQHGEDIELAVSEKNTAEQPIRYRVIRNLKNGTQTTYIFCREDDPSILWRDTLKIE